jgi:hypothetical protein
VLATRNRSASLARTLSGLAAQQGAPRFEVIVADNGSTDDTAVVVAGFGATLDVRRIDVPQAGKGRALNAALRDANGALIVFTDDDVEPDAGWLSALQAAADRHPAFGVFGGRIDIDEAALPGWIRRSRKLSELLAALHHRTEPIYEHGRYPFGPNMAVRRHLIAGNASPYPEDLGPGTPMPVGDETAFLSQLSAPDADDRLYVPHARVLHRPGSHHFTFMRAAKRSWIQGLNESRFGISGPTRGPAPRGSMVRRAAARVLACRSLRELGCVFVQHGGYVLGRTFR